MVSIIDLRRPSGIRRVQVVGPARRAEPAGGPGRGPGLAAGGGTTEPVRGDRVRGRAVFLPALRGFAIARSRFSRFAPLTWSYQLPSLRDGHGPGRALNRPLVSGFAFGSPGATSFRPSGTDTAPAGALGW